MFWYNYKTGKFGERALIIAVILSIVALCWPEKEKGAYKSML
jgi:hypothetical protein